MSREACSGFCLESLALGVDSLFAQRVLAGVDEESPLPSFHICFSSHGLFTVLIFKCAGILSRRKQKENFVFITSDCCQSKCHLILL